MKNFTNLFKHKTNPLWIRLLIMVFMLIGANTAWSAYYAVGPAVGGWGTWVELTTTDNNKYTCLASPGEFKITSQSGGWDFDKNWNTVVGGTGVTKSNNNGNNASLQDGYNQICFYPSGNNNNGWLEGEKVSVTATAYVVGGYYGGEDKNYSSGKNLTKQSNGTYSGTFSDFNGTCYFQIYDDIRRIWGCDYVEKNVGESVTLSTSKSDKVRYSLTNGISYVFTFDPSDGTFLVAPSCDAPTSVTIGSAPQVKPCPGDEVTLTSSVSGGTGDIEYSWSVSGTGWSIKNSANTNSSCTFVVGTGTGTINLSATQCSTEIEATEVTIDVKSKLTKSNYTLQESADYTGSSITPTIQPGSGIPIPKTVKYGASAATATTTAPTAVGSYKVYISTDATDSYCAATDLEIGTFNIVCPAVAAPTITATSNVIKCGNDVTTNGTITIDNNYVNTSTYKLQLGSNEAQTVTPTNGVFSVSANGVYTLTVTNSCGSSNSTSNISVGLTQNKPTISAIQGDQYLCAGSGAHTYRIDAIDNATYSWSIEGAGLALGTDDATETTVTPGVLTTRVDGTLTVTVTDNASGCPATRNKSISLIPLPTLTSISPDRGDFCSGETIADLENSLTIVKSEGTTTKWYKYLVEQPSNTVLEKATYAVRVRSGEGCLSDDVKEYTVTNIITVPTIKSIGIDKGSICEGEEATITVKADGATSYTLYKVTNNPTLVETKTGDANGVTFSVETAGTYKFKATNSCGTTANFSDPVQLTVTPVPTFTKEPSAVTLCSSATSITVANLISATGAEVDVDDATITLYNENGEEVTENIDINVTSQRTTNYKLKASISTCSSEFKEFTLTVNPIPAKPDFGANSEFVCQRTTVNLPAELNSVQLRWYSDQDRKTLITSFQANAQKIVYAAAYNGTCESAELTPYTYDIYPVPTITVTPSTATSAMCNELVTVTATVTNRMDGALVYWYEGNTQVGTGDEYTFTKETATTVSNLRAEICNSVNCAPVSAEVPDIEFTAHPDCGPSYVQGKILYFNPKSNDVDWSAESPIYKATFNNNKGTYVLIHIATYDAYACEIPEGATKVTFERWKSDNSAKWNYSAEVTLTAEKTNAFKPGKNNDNSWNGANPKSYEIGSLKTIALNAGAPGTYWNQDNAAFYAYAWNSKTSAHTDPWPKMIDSNGDGVYVVDVNTEYDRILFQRANPSGGEWNRTADLELDIYGNEFKIEDINGHGYWHWRWFKSTYDLGVQTNVVEQNGDNQEIHCTGVVYKTDCAPGIKYGFEYATNEAMTNPTYVECGQGYMAAGASFEKYITVEPGEYYVRAKVQYENNAAVYGGVKKVVIANQCDANYEFAVGNTSTTVQACGGSRELPALEIISDKNVGGGTITWSYEWKNSDGSAATKLSETDIASPTFEGTASQTYKVRVIKKVNGTIKCTQTAEYQVVYDDNSPKGAIEAPATVQINQEVMLQGSINNSEGFTWMVEEGGDNVTSLMLSDATILNPTFNTKEAGVYTITLTPDNNFTCKAIPVEHTLTVTAPEEICGSNDIEVKLAGSHNCFTTNSGSNLYVSQDGSTWISVGKIDNGKSYKFTADYFAEKGLTLPVKIFFGALSGNHCGGDIELKGYTKIQTLSTEEQGYLITYTIGNPSGSTTDVNGYGREFTVTTNKVSNTTISAPTVTSPTSIVEGKATQATLMAYLSATGCSAINEYGFQYIMQNDEPTSADGATPIELSLPVTIGKSFKTTLTGLAQGVYWFRGYATNEGGKTGYTAWSSFTIITNGPYPTLQCGLGALQLLANDKIQVIVTNQGTQPVLQGSYSLSIVNQGAPMVFTPLPVPAIAAGGSATFTTTNPVANKNNYSVTATLTYKGRKQQCSIKACTPQECCGDTIFYTIDAAAVTDKCMLVFPTVYEAISHLKSSTGANGFVTKDQNKEGYMLNQPVVMQVVYAKDPYKGNVRVGTTGGMTDGRPEPLIISLTNINNDGNDGTGTYHPLIIRAANPNAKPALQHIAIRKSRNITLANLNLVSSETDVDNAIDIDNNNNNWVENEIGRFANANVTVKNCLVKSKGFTCVHVSAVTRVFFIENEFLADLSDSEINEYNTRVWGASAKFIRCKDILFLRNNFTGTHATSVWLQEVDGALIMNNVFWNNNQIGDSERCAMIRLVQQKKNYYPRNIGVYYNTMYLADCDTRKDGKNPKFDFLRINNPEANSDINWAGNFTEGGTNYLHTTVEFMYNNCYSYDDKTPGKSTYPFYGHGTWNGLCHNNFWSVKDQNTTPAPSISAFAFGDCDVNYVNVKENVCNTTASDPNSLVIKGSDLNTGEQPDSDLAIQLGANLVVSDRTREDIRPTTPTIIDPDDVPSGVVDAGGMAPSIALVVSDEADKGTMTHTIDVATYVGATRGFEYTPALESENEYFTMQDDENGTVTVSFNKDGKTKNLTYSDNLIISKDNVDKIIIPITGKYVASYTGGWTLGAYQQTEAIATDSIIWQGSVSDDWDNRNNWLDAKTKTTLTCVNTLAKDLKVIIPAPHSENYPAPDEKGIVTYPKLPAFDSDSRDDKYGNEIVNAGQGDNNFDKYQFADHIYMEYGAALQGVENLVDGDVRRYNEATTHLTVDREKWFLVGNMVKPFTNVNKTETRLTISGDYYITRQEPRVYMHQITVENDKPAWQHTFPDLDVTIQDKEVFAINIPDLYGSMRFNAQFYYTYVSPNPSKLNDGTVPKSYTFNGRFINESEPLTFEGLSSSPKLVNNTYPCNLSASDIENDGDYTVYLYDHDKNSWVTPVDASSKIKPQHGFAITKKKGAETLTVTTEMLANGNTYHYEKSASATMPYHVIELYNANSTDGYASQIQVIYDAEKGAAQLDARDAEKLWSNNTMVPDLYMMMYDVTLQRLYVEKPEMVIPLGVRLQQDMDVTFKMAKTNGIEKAILQDRLTGKEYDLTGNKEATITGLEVGDSGVIEGRFYLNLVAEDQFNFDTPTDITDAFVETSSINIYVNNGNNLSVLANNVELQTIYVSDMSGRTQRYDVSGNYANITLPVSQGVYVVQVIGDNLTRTDKVIVK